MVVNDSGIGSRKREAAEVAHPGRDLERAVGAERRRLGGLLSIADPEAPLALALPAAFWWTYFTDSEAAGHALGRAEGETRSRLAVHAYYFAYLPILLGIVGAAAGIHAAIAHPGDPASLPSSLALADGTACDEPPRAAPRRYPALAVVFCSPWYCRLGVRRHPRRTPSARP